MEMEDGEWRGWIIVDILDGYRERRVVRLGRRLMF